MAKIDFKVISNVEVTKECHKALRHLQIDLDLKTIQEVTAHVLEENMVNKSNKKESDK